MKNLFSILLCFQLMIAPLAMAADPAPANPGTEAGLSDAYLKTGTGSKGGYDFYVNQIMTIATSAIGSSIITQCLEGLKTPSIATFMAGSLTHIMSEIVGAKAKNERHQKKRKDLEIKVEELKKSGDTAQLEALKAALQEEKDTHKFLENRKKWMIAVTAIYTAAMGLAIAEEVYGLASGVSMATAACSALAAKCTAGYAACYPKCMLVVPAAIAEAKANFSTPEARTVIITQCSKYADDAPACLALQINYTNFVYGSCLMLATDGGASMLSWSTLLTLAYGFGASKAGAGAGKVAQYGTMIVSLLPLITQSFSKLVVQMYNFPIPRSITFGAAAVFSGTVTAGLASRSNIAMQNVTKLQNAVYQFKENSAGDDTGLGTDDAYINGTGTNQNAAAPKDGKLKDLAAGVKKKECFSNGPKGMEHSASGCANPVKLPKYRKGQFNLPAINHVAGLASDMAQALANGDEAGAANMAGEIGSYAARVKAETDKLQDQYNEIEKKANRPTKDFKKSIAAQVASMQADVAKTASSNGVNLASAGAALSGDKEVMKDETTPEVTTAAGGPAVALPAVDPLAGFGTEEAPVEDVSGVAAAKAEQSLDEFESTEEDINKKPEVSIFKQLSNRYILNYTKMFERKKDPEVAEEPKKN